MLPTQVSDPAHTKQTLKRACRPCRPCSLCYVIEQGRGSAAVPSHCPWPKTTALDQLPTKNLLDLFETTVWKQSKDLQKHRRHRQPVGSMEGKCSKMFQEQCNSLFFFSPFFCCPSWDIASLDRHVATGHSPEPPLRQALQKEWEFGKPTFSSVSFGFLLKRPMQMEFNYDPSAANVSGSHLFSCKTF